MNTKTTHYDVIVIGLGPAGARAAWRAARGGLTVLAVDRKAIAGQPVQCAELVPGLVGLDRVGISAHRGQSVTRMTTRLEHQAAHECAPFPGHMIDRATFDAAQVKAARAAGAQCRLGTVVRAIEGGALVLDSGARIAAPVLVGADGPFSLLGRKLGQVNRALVYAHQITVDLHAAQDATDIFLSADLPGGYGWLFPKARRAHIGVGVDAAFRAALKPQLERLHRQLHRDGRVGAEIMTRTGGVIPVGGALKPFAHNGATLALLAGDAAGLSNPVTGAGIHAALVSGELAGAAAVEWLAGNVDAGIEYAEELDELFGSALRRAVARRRVLQDTARHRRPRPDDLRRAWIAFPEYWQSAPTAAAQEIIA